MRALRPTFFPLPRGPRFFFPGFFPFSFFPFFFFFLFFLPTHGGGGTARSASIDFVFLYFLMRRCCQHNFRRRRWLKSHQCEKRIFAE
jgi:hypothetical protein